MIKMQAIRVSVSQGADNWCDFIAPYRYRLQPTNLGTMLIIWSRVCAKGCVISTEAEGGTEKPALSEVEGICSKRFLRFIPPLLSSTRRRGWTPVGMTAATEC